MDLRIWTPIGSCSRKKREGFADQLFSKKGRQRQDSTRTVVLAQAKDSYVSPEGQIPPAERFDGGVLQYHGVQKPHRFALGRFGLEVDGADRSFHTGIIKPEAHRFPCSAFSEQYTQGMPLPSPHSHYPPNCCVVLCHQHETTTLHHNCLPHQPWP